MKLTQMNFKFKILFLIIIIICFGCNIKSITTYNTDSQKPAPTFNIESIDKTTQISINKYKNIPVVLNFWFPSCPPCKIETSYLQQLHEEFDGSVQFIGIQQIGIDSPQDGLIFIKEKGITYPMGIGTSKMLLDYKINSYPTTIFINKNHKIILRHEGPLSLKSLRNKINQLIY